MKEMNLMEEKLLSFKEMLIRTWEGFKPQSPELQGLRDSLEYEVKSVLREIDHTINVLRAPVFVGLLGRYSHGKTALANALFGIPEDFTLPEGEGVVTSKITRIDFEGELSIPKAYLVKRDGKREEIEINTLRKLASSEGDEALEEASLIDYLHLQLPPTGEFSKLFADKKISLIDMPGLGGPYFKDSIRIQKYIERLDFLLVVIKITEIDKAGKAIERFITKIKLPPVICVFTFYDKVRESPLFKDLTDDEDIQQKAIELAKQHIPSLVMELESKSIFVSSKSGFNIEELREFILNFVAEKAEAIDKIRQETPQVFRRRLNEMKQEVSKLEGKIEDLIKKLASSHSMDVSDKRKQLPLFRKFEREEKREMRNIRRDISLILKDAQRRIESCLVSFLDASDCQQAKKIIEEAEFIVQDFLKELEVEINTQFNERIKPLLKSATMKFIERDLNLSPQRKVDLEEAVEEEVDNYNILLDWDKSIALSGEFAVKCAASQSKDILKRIMMNFSDSRFLMMIGFSFIFLVIGKHIPMVGSTLKSIGIIGILGSIMYALITSPAEKAHFNRFLKDFYRDMKMKFSTYFRELEEYINHFLTSTLEELKDNITEIVETETNEVVKDIRNFKRLIKTLEENFFEVRNTVKSFTKALQYYETAGVTKQ
jgi:predicted GTPase